MARRTGVDRDDPQAFYDAYGREEWDRLDGRIHDRLEFEETIRALETQRPDSGRVLDAGGGAGRYSIWLAERGYDVTLLDLSRRQLDIARDEAAARGVASEIQFLHGTITDLGLPDDAFATNTEPVVADLSVHMLAIGHA